MRGGGERRGEARKLSRLRDPALAVALFALSLLPLGVRGLELGGLASTVPSWVGPALAALLTLPLAARTRAPALVLAAVGAGFALAQLTGADTGLAGLGLLVAIASAASWQRRRRLGTAVAGLVAYAALAVALVHRGSPEPPLSWFTFAALLGLCWCLGELARRRRADLLARERQTREEAARHARALVARDLHDVVTHHVTAMVVQAESAAYLPAADDAERARTLTTIGATGRLALTELRTLLGALEPGRAADAPVRPDSPLSLAARLREAGYPVTVHAPEGDEVADEEISAALNAVAREAVTNAMKHARGAPVTVTVRVHPPAITVANALTPGEPTEALTGSTQGLAGLRARVEEAGGVFEAGPTGSGGFVVGARWEARS